MIRYRHTTPTGKLTSSRRMFFLRLKIKNIKSKFYNSQRGKFFNSIYFKFTDKCVDCAQQVIVMM